MLTAFVLLCSRDTYEKGGDLWLKIFRVSKARERAYGPTRLPKAGRHNQPGQQACWTFAQGALVRSMDSVLRFTFASDLPDVHKTEPNPGETESPGKRSSWLFFMNSATRGEPVNVTTAVLLPAMNSERLRESYPAVHGCPPASGKKPSPPFQTPFSR